MFTVSDLKQTRVYQDALDEGLEHERSLIIKLLTHKTGTLSPEILTSVQSLSFEQLDLLGEALLDFERSEDVIDWLSQQS